MSAPNKFDCVDVDRCVNISALDVGSGSASLCNDVMHVRQSRTVVAGDATRIVSLSESAETFPTKLVRHVVWVAIHDCGARQPHSTRVAATKTTSSCLSFNAVDVNFADRFRTRSQKILQNILRNLL